MTRTSASSKGRSRKKGASKAIKSKSKPTKVTSQVDDSGNSSALNALPQIDNSDTTTRPTFHLFPRLPIEIRLRIWKLAGPKPVIVKQAKALGYKPLYTIMHPRPTPAVLHVCQESRKEFLYREDEAANEGKNHALYRQAFPSTNGLMCHFSFEVDTLHLTSVREVESHDWPNGPRLYGRGSFKARLDLAEKDVIRELRFLAVDMSLIQQLETVFFKSLARYQKLEELIFLVVDPILNINVIHFARQAVVSKFDKAKREGLIRQELVLKFRDPYEFRKDPRA